MDVTFIPFVVILAPIVLFLLLFFLKTIATLLFYAIKEFAFSHRSASSKKKEEDKYRNDLLEGILILSAEIIKAGGKQQQYQIQFVKEFLTNQFGIEVVPEAMYRLDTLLNQNKIDFYQALPKMRGVRVDTLIRYLISLAIADGEFSNEERDLIERIGIYMNLAYNDIKSIIASIYSEFYGDEKKDDFKKINQDKTTPSEYAILEISTSATDEEVLAAFRRKAMEFHPDRGGDEEIFKQINEAYQSIKKERGMN